ncbi:hypothetical protein KAR91_81990 [Candidatus Pacearchaeota archaeon]|nr:hypothetical protein [Candidatus Pacearchaeota archaeon]
MITAILWVIYLSVLFALLVRHRETVENGGQWPIAVITALAWPIIMGAAYLLFAIPTIQAYINIGNKSKGD